MKYMTENNLFTDAQYDFREKRSCIFHLFDVLDNLTSTYDASCQNDVTYI